MNKRVGIILNWIASTRLYQFCKRVFLQILFLKPVPDATRCAVPLTQNGRFNISIRFTAVIIGVICLGAAICCKFWKIQINEHSKHLSEADSILGFRQTLIGTRGEIFDFSNNLLAGNLRTKDLYITPKLVIGSKEDLQMIDELAIMLSQHLNIRAVELSKKCRDILKRRQDLLVAKNISNDTAIALGKLRLNCVDITPSPENGSSKHTFEVHFFPLDIKDAATRDDIIATLAERLNLEEAELFQRVNRVLRRQTPILAYKNIELDKAREIQAAFAEWNVGKTPSGKTFQKIPSTAIHFEESTLRIYPKERILANLLGFCDPDGKGISGIEALMDEEMKSTTSSRYITLDGNVGRTNFSRNLYDNNQNGSNIHLTIDLPIQQIVERHLAKLVENNGPKKAYAVMMNPKSGAIMALAQYPSFNYNEPLTENDNRSFHALVNTYEPGSIMKAVTVSSAMDYAGLTPDTVVFCENGSWRYGGGKPLGEHGTARFGDLTLLQVIQKSSNIGSAKAVIENMSESVFYNYLLAFGMGQKTHVGFFPKDSEPKFFENESPGLLRPVEKWYKIDISRISIGHTINITPFQMVQAYGAIANGGEMMQPYIIDRVVRPDGTVINSVPMKKGQPISPQTAAKIIECMCATVEKGGTATSAAMKEYRVAGKTGTATKLVKINGKWVYDKRKNTASFIGLVPVENPAFVLLITADEPSGRFQYGGSVCGSTFRAIAEETLKLLQVPPSFIPEEENDAQNKR